MTTEWFKQVSKVVRDEVAKPFLPGDPDPLVEVLKKVVSKLYAGCQNGGEYGADECPSCRALRTEQAEKEAKRLAKGLEIESASKVEWATKATQAESNVVKLNQTVSELQKLVEGLVVKLSQFEVNAVALTEQVAGISAENGELSKHLAARDLSVAILTSAVEAHVKEAKRVKDLVSQLAGE